MAGGSNGELELSALQETKVSTPIEDDVIQQGDTQYHPRRLKLTGHLNVSDRWLKASGGMVVGNDDRRCAIRQRVCEDLAWVNRRPVDQTDRYNPNVQYLIRAVDRRAKEMFLLPVGVVPDVGQKVGGCFDLRTFRLDSPARELNPRQNQRGLCISYAFELRQIVRLEFQALFVDKPR